jgi:hypothetical protein
MCPVSTGNLRVGDMITLKLFFAYHWPNLVLQSPDSAQPVKPSAKLIDNIRTGPGKTPPLTIEVPQRQHVTLYNS